jgi:iron(III) transport system substrate-binding protein
LPPTRPPHASICAVLALVLAIALGACSATSEDTGSDGSDEPETEGITLYSGRIPAAIGGAVDAYEADADRDVQVRFGETGDLAATLIEEGGNSPADVFFAQEPGAIGALAERGLLAELPRDILERVPAVYRDAGGSWVGVTGRARVIAYGPGVDRAQLPPSPLGLTAPEWRSRVGWSPASESLQQYVTALRLRYGEDAAREWVEGMVANDAVEFPDNVAIRDAIAAGEIDVGLINHYYIAQAVAAEGPDYPVRAYYPPRGLGSLLLLTSVGVLESSDRKEEALDFVRSLLSPPTQRFFTASSKEYPLAKGVEPDPSLSVPLARIPATSGEELADVTELQATIEMMQEAGAL